MSDIVTVTTKVDFEAWTAPSCVKMALEDNGTQVWISNSELERHVLDALAKQWLDHLYANVGRESPFMPRPEAP